MKNKCGKVMCTWFFVLFFLKKCLSINVYFGLNLFIRKAVAMYDNLEVESSWFSRIEN